MTSAGPTVRYDDAHHPITMAQGKTLLTYGMTTNPSPLQVSPATSASSVGTLTFVVSVPPRGKVTVNQIAIVLPIGDPGKPDATDLSEVAPPLSAASISSSGTAEWVPAAGAANNVFLFHPKNNKPVLLKTESLTIVLSGIQISPLVGTALIHINEWAIQGEHTPPPTGGPASGSATIDVAKFPYQFVFQQFVPQRPSVARGQHAVLTWQGSTNATYTMAWEE